MPLAAFRFLVRASLCRDICVSVVCRRAASWPPTRLLQRSVVVYLRGCCWAGRRLSLAQCRRRRLSASCVLCWYGRVVAI